MSVSFAERINRSCIVLFMALGRGQAITTAAVSVVDQCSLPRKHKLLQAMHSLNFRVLADIHN